LCAELLNTAIEAVIDLVSPEWHPLAKVAKDTAAGAVLVSAVFAVAVGLVILYKPLMIWLGLN
jgi:undecaprenol kinase